MTSESVPPETARLAALVGLWRTEGSTLESAGTPPVRIEATDSYEWLPGRFALLHRVEAQMGAEKIEGAEIIGYDPERGCFVSQYFGSDGPNAYEASLDEEGGRLVWRMQSSSDRFIGAFDAAGERIDGHWELLGKGSTWVPWMNITLTRRPR
jgi:hypothetical protein